MSHRFFIDSPLRTGEVTLAGDEAHHLLRVMRARVGDEVTLFDGRGGEALARVTAAGGGAVRLDVLDPRAVDREAPRRVILGVALPKGERQRWLVEKAVELGAARLVPLIAARNVAEPHRAAERLARAVVETSKQCGRNRLMEVAPPQPLAEYLRSAPPEALRLIAIPQAAAAVAERLAPPALVAVREVFLAVGPEGGFTDEEAALARSLDWTAVNLGPRTLRVETAALLLTALAAQ